MAISSVMPMPPCSWMAFWPTKRQARPICTLAAETALARSAAALVELDVWPCRSSRPPARRWMNMSTMRCCSTWKAAIGCAELLALLGVVERALVQLAQHAAGLGADGGDRLVHHLLDQRQGLRLPAPIRASAPSRDVLEGDLRGAPAVDGRIVAGDDARGAPSRPGTPRRRSASRWPPPVRAVTIRWVAQGAPTTTALCAVQHIAGAVLARRGLQVGQVVAALRLGVGEGDRSPRRR